MSTRRVMAFGRGTAIAWMEFQFPVQQPPQQRQLRRLALLPRLRLYRPAWQVVVRYSMKRNLVMGATILRQRMGLRWTSFMLGTLLWELARTYGLDITTASARKACDCKMLYIVQCANVFV